MMYLRFGFGLLLIANLTFPVITLGQDSSPSDVGATHALEPYVGKPITMQMGNGATLESVLLERVVLDPELNQPQRILVKLANGRKRNLSMSLVRTIRHEGELVFEGAANPDSSRTKSKSESAAEQSAQLAAKEKEKWIARLTARGIEPWQELTEQEHWEAIAAHKKRFEEVAALLPGLRLFETDHFLFCTNIPPQQVGQFIASLDRMYAWMQATYGIDAKTSVWRGKASIFAFVREEEFAAFEQRFMDHQPQPNTGGLCHSDGERNVCIAVHQGTDADYFGLVLVHETSHGFIHCYKTPVRVPSWVNEGMAEVIASMMVPTSKGVQQKEKKFVQSLLSVPQPRLGDEFFAVDQNIPFDRYGGASSMTRFLLQTNQQRYVRFINSLKEGMPWEAALAESFSATKPQLVGTYGRWIGVPHLGM